MNKLQAMELAAGLAGLVTGMETDLIQNIAAYLLAGKIESDVSKWKSASWRSWESSTRRISKQSPHTPRAKRALRS